MQELELDKPYQVLDAEGVVVGKLPDGLHDEQMLHWLRVMWQTRFFSNKVVALQRQGRATTWIPSLGQEAAAVGMATSLQPQDWLTGSPREVGGYFLKGVPPAAIAYSCRGYPVPAALFGDGANCLPLTIVIGTQALQSVGLAMAAKIRGDNAVVMCSCGDGATSEGEFNEALNFAGVYKAPVVMLVVNNGWAISVPRHQQTAAKWIASRGAGFGMPGRLVDGNDILGMYAVTREAVARARAGDGPTLIEAVTYRRAAHSTADDPSRYCPPEEIALWETRDPIKRFSQFLLNRGTLDAASYQGLIDEAEAEIARQLQIAYDYPTPPPEAMFGSVYAAPTLRLRQQQKALLDELQG